MKKLILQFGRIILPVLYLGAVLLLQSNTKQGLANKPNDLSGVSSLSAPDGSPSWHTGPESVPVVGGDSTPDFSKKHNDWLSQPSEGGDLPGHEPLTHYTLRALDFPVILQRIGMLFPFHSFL